MLVSRSMLRPIQCLIRWLRTSCLIESWMSAKVTRFRSVFEAPLSAFLPVCISLLLALSCIRLSVSLTMTNARYKYVHDTYILHVLWVIVNLHTGLAEPSDISSLARLSLHPEGCSQWVFFFPGAYSASLVGQQECPIRKGFFFLKKTPKKLGWCNMNFYVAAHYVG